MAILDFNQTSRAPSRSTPFAGQTNPSDRPKAKLWLNVGYEAKGTGKFINLPIGLPVDTMEPADIRGQNIDWVKQRTAQNALLEALKSAGMKMEPGQEEVLNLQVRIRRVNEALEVESADNEYSADFSQLFAAPAVSGTATAEEPVPAVING